jgi:hypothetical protein
MESSWFIESTHRRVVSVSASADARAAWPLLQLLWRQPP